MVDTVRHIRSGLVVHTRDTTRSGTLWIQPDGTDDGTPGDNIIAASMGSPSVGAGYGFFHVPGPGSRVLYAELSQVGETHIPNKYVWFASVAVPVLMTAGRNVAGNDVHDAEDFVDTQIDLDGAPPTATGLRYNAGIPNIDQIYRDNDLPQAAVWKAPPGHFIQMSHKTTDKGTCDIATLIMNASGKYIKLDDGPPGKGMDRITISDEAWEHGGNRMEIKTGDADKPNSILLQSKQDQDYISVEGSQLMAITGGEGSQMRECVATGGIHDIAYTGEHNTEAETAINRTCHTGDITDSAPLGNIIRQAGQSIEIRCGASVIRLNPGSIDISSPIINICGQGGEVTIGATGLVTHEHISPFFGLPTLGHPYVPVPCTPFGS